MKNLLLTFLFLLLGPAMVWAQESSKSIEQASQQEQYIIIQNGKPVLKGTVGNSTFSTSEIDGNITLKDVGIIITPKAEYIHPDGSLEQLKDNDRVNLKDGAIIRESE